MIHEACLRPYGKVYGLSNQQSIKGDTSGRGQGLARDVAGMGRARSGPAQASQLRE